MTDDFTLNVRGQKYAGWTDLSVTRSMEQLAHSFSLSLTDKWTTDGKSVPVVSGDICSIAYGTKRVSTGYVDDDSKTYDANQRTQSFTGRSKTADLIDCSPARTSRKSWRKATLLSIAEQLCDPFNIAVTANVDTGLKFSRFAIEEGETVFAALERAARQRGVLMVTDGDGDLVFDRAGSTKVATTLKWGVNILAGGATRSMRDRFSEYTVVCQSTGSDELFGSNTSIKRTSTDPGVERSRPITIMADTEDSGSELQKRADWERNVRAGRARRYTYTVQGWEHESGLWTPNALVRVVDPEFDLDDELLIVSTTQRRSNQGTTTELSLTGKEAFDVQPLPLKKKKGRVFP